MIKISIIPIVKKYYNGHIFGVDRKLIIFLTKLFKRNEIEILTRKSKLITDLLIISGGNSITRFSNEKGDLIRDKLDDFFLREALRKRIPVLGICHGAHYIANKFGAKLIKDLRHGKVRKHDLIIRSISKKKIYKINSFHNISIKNYSKNLISIGTSRNGNVEYFKHKKYNLTGIMWHPERESKIKNIDKKIIKEIIK